MVLEYRYLVSKHFFGRDEGGRYHSRVREASRIVRRRLDQDVEAKGGPGDAVKDCRDAFDDELPDIMFLK